MIWILEKRRRALWRTRLRTRSSARRFEMMLEVIPFVLDSGEQTSRPRTRLRTRSSARCARCSRARTWSRRERSARTRRTRSGATTHSTGLCGVRTRYRWPRASAAAAAADDEIQTHLQTHLKTSGLFVTTGRRRRTRRLRWCRSAACAATAGAPWRGLPALVARWELGSVFFAPQPTRRDSARGASLWTPGYTHTRETCLCVENRRPSCA